MPTTITGSDNIAILDSDILIDQCEGEFVIDITPSTWIGGGAGNALGASIKITNPYNVIVKNYPTSGYDIYAPFTSSISFDIPTQASNYQYGTYTIVVQLTDSDGTLHTISKPVKVSVPDTKNKTRNYGSLSADLDGDCVAGKLTVIADTPPNYQGFATDSQVNLFTLLFPTVSEVDPLDTALGSFSVQLYEGEYRFTGTMCAHYSLGDNVFANVNYRVKKYKIIRCLLDRGCVATRLASLQTQKESDCTDAEKQDTQDTIAEALFLLTLIDSLAKDGQDPSIYIAKLETVLGCVCTCNCAEGTPIINNAPVGDFVVEGCNVSSAVYGLTTTYTIGENYAYVVQWAPNGGAITVTTTTNGCVKTQEHTFNIATVYSQIKAQIVNSTEFNIWADFVNQALIGLDGDCLGLTTPQLNALTLKQKMQAIISGECAGGNCDAIISTNAASSSANDVILTWVNVSDVYEVAVYLDDILAGTVLNPTATFTLVGAADGTNHTYKLIPKCSNGSVGVLFSASFNYYGCPAIALPTLSDTNIADATCPYDLSALVDALPVGITAEWHSLNNTLPTSLVVDPTLVSSGTYYVFAKDSNGCYSLGVQVIVSCATDATCSAPQNLLAEAITGDFMVSFKSAAYPPPLNSYTVKRRLTAAADIPGNYTTIGTPTWNAGDNEWQIVDTTGIDNTLYTYRAFSNCASTSPYTDYIFANLVCPTVTLTPDETTMDYSFTGVGGGADKYEVYIYDVTGVTLIHTDTHVPAFPSPIIGTFFYLDAGTTYRVSVRIFIGTYSTLCSYVVGTTDQADTISAPTYMNLASPSFSGTIEVATIGGRTLRFSNFSVCGMADAQIIISGGIGTIDNDITSGTPNDDQNVDTLIPVGSYTYTGTLTAGCTSTAGISFI